MKLEIKEGENGKTVIEIDCYGANVSQMLLDKIYVAAAQHPGGADITLRNVATSPFPRIVADYGELYDTLCEVAKEYREYRRMVEAHPWGIQTAAVEPGEPVGGSLHGKVPE